MRSSPSRFSDDAGDHVGAYSDGLAGGVEAERGQDGLAFQRPVDQPSTFGMPISRIAALRASRAPAATQFSAGAG